MAKIGEFLSFHGGCRLSRGPCHGSNLCDGIQMPSIKLS